MKINIKQTFVHIMLHLFASLPVSLDSPVRLYLALLLPAIIPAQDLLVLMESNMGLFRNCVALSSLSLSRTDIVWDRDVLLFCEILKHFRHFKGEI